MREKSVVTVKCLVQILRVFVPPNPEIGLKPAFFRQYRIADEEVTPALSGFEVKRGDAHGT